MSFSSVDHKAKTDVKIDSVNMDIGKVVSAVESVEQVLKRTPPPVINNEITAQPPTVVNRIDTPSPQVHMYSDMNQLKDSIISGAWIISGTMIGLELLKWVYPFLEKLINHVQSQ